METGRKIRQHVRNTKDDVCHYKDVISVAKIQLELKLVSTVGHSK